MHNHFLNTRYVIHYPIWRERDALSKVTNGNQVKMHITALDPQLQDNAKCFRMKVILSTWKRFNLTIQGKM